MQQLESKELLYKIRWRGIEFYFKKKSRRNGIFSGWEKEYELLCDKEEERSCERENASEIEICDDQGMLYFFIEKKW